MTALPGTTTDPHRLDRPPRLVPAVVSALVSRIVSGEFGSDTELPKEAALVTQYGVSRTVVREALRVLEEKGLIAIQQGRATTVRPQDAWDLLDPMVVTALVEQDSGSEVVGQLVRVRAVLEADMAAQVAASKRPADLQDQLDRLLAEMAAAVEDQDRYVALDKAFHALIMRATGNIFSQHIVRQIHVWAHETVRAAYSLADIKASHDQHTAIRDAIVAADAERSKAQMYDHILGSWTRKVARLNEVRTTGARSS
jgi:DNA-binding FadR family transcriptional regulator